MEPTQIEFKPLIAPAEPWHCACGVFIGYQQHGRLRIGNAFVPGYECVQGGKRKPWYETVGPLEKRTRRFFHRLARRWDAAPPVDNDEQN